MYRTRFDPNDVDGTSLVVCPKCNNIPLALRNNTKTKPVFEITDICLYDRGCIVKWDEDIYCSCGQLLFKTDAKTT